MKISAGTAFTAGLLAAGTLFLTLALGLGAGDRLIPLSVAAPLTALLLIQLIRELRRGEVVHTPRVERAAVGWIAGLAVLILLGGLLAGPALFVSLYLRRKAREGWFAVVASGVLTALALWLVVTRALGTVAPGGLAGDLLLSRVAD